VARRWDVVVEAPSPEDPRLGEDVCGWLAEAARLEAEGPELARSGLEDVARGRRSEALELRLRSARQVYAEAGMVPTPLDVLRWARRARLGPDCAI
jgi:hypothetical protein